MLYFTNQIRSILLLCLLTLNSFAQNGPICNPTQRATGLGSTVQKVYSDGTTVYAACFDAFTGGLGISTDGGASFSYKTTADGLGSNSVFGVYAVGSTIYAATRGYPFIDVVGGLGISTNGGSSFTNRTITNGLGSNNINGVYAVGSTIYASTEGGLSISTNGGNTFTNRTTADGLGSNNVIGVYAQGNTVYAATNAGVSISTDGGNTFTNHTTGLGSSFVFTVYAQGNTVYAATDAGVSISTDGGNTFTNYTTGLASNSVRQVYAIGTTIYASTTGDGTDGGVSISTDGGASFTNYTSFMVGTISTNGVNGVFAASGKVYAAVSGGLFSCADLALPVELVSFSAKLTPQGSTQLDWQTAWERNADRFEVQRSLNNLEQFQTLGTLAAQGTTDTRQTYRFTDLNPAEGTNYYRLKQSDRDGSVQYSKIVAVTINPDQPLLSVQTNPITDGQLQIRLRKWQAADLQLTTSGGRLIATWPTTNADGTLTLQPLQPLAAGVYILTAKRIGQQQSVRVIWSQ